MSGDDTLNPMLNTFFFWTFRTCDPQFPN